MGTTPKAKKKGLRGEEADTYVYGTMRKPGWKPKKERAKGRNK